MTDGTVTRDRKIVMPLDVHCKDGSSVSVDALVDTGFNGHLTLPEDLLRLVHAEEDNVWTVELGDGNTVEMNSYAVEVNWLGSVRHVVVLESESEPLLGISMLWDHRVSFEAVNGGKVSVATLET